MHVNIPADINFETSMFWVASNAGIMDKTQSHNSRRDEIKQSKNEEHLPLSIFFWETRMLEYLLV